MYPNYMQFPNSPTAVDLNPYGRQNGIQTAVPMPSQQFNPQRFMPIMYGKFVDREEDITPNDVPMDGNIGYFPINDGSAIITKKWNSDGTIKTVVYKAKDEEVVCDEKKDKLDMLIERIEKMEKKIDAINKSSKREEAKS